MNKLFKTALMGAVVLAMLAACGNSDAEPSTASGAVQAESATFSAAMITDVGGVNDESFNQSAWGGMERLEAELGVDVSFLESEKDADYAPNLDKKTDEGHDVIWGIGFLMKDAVQAAAESNPDQTYALVDDAFEPGAVPNAIGVVFQAEQSSFLAGYVAAYKTETDHVGFLIGMESPVMDRFRYGYQAGVQYGAWEQGKEIRYDYAVAESFSDTAKGKAMAQKMYTDGADVIFHAAGQTGSGAIEAAREMNKMVIGVDLDQNWLAPDNVITSALKNVGNAVFSVTERIKAGEDLGGTNVVTGLADGGVGLAPSSDKHLSAELLSAVEDIEQKIKDGEIVVPYTSDDFDTFVGSLQ